MLLYASLTLRPPTYTYYTYASILCTIQHAYALQAVKQGSNIYYSKYLSGSPPVYLAPVFTCFAPKTSKQTPADTFAYFDAATGAFKELINTIPGETGSTELCCHGNSQVYDKVANTCSNPKSNGKGN
jgi:hypothetical protein